jgi:sulfite exporter TauE/SafE
MIPIVLSLGTAAALGATSGVHCAAMCGPIAAVGSSVQGKLDKLLVLRYGLGRLSGYSLLGAIAGGIAAPLTTGETGEVVRLVLGVVVAILLLYRALVLVRPASGQRLVQFGRRSPVAVFFQTLVRYVPRRGLGLGLATALFPCGALYAGVFAAASSGSALLGAAMMAVFAISSFPLLMLPAFAAAKLGNRLTGAWARKTGAVVLVLAAAWVVTPPIRSLLAPADKPACCAHRVDV